MKLLHLLQMLESALACKLIEGLVCITDLRCISDCLLLLSSDSSEFLHVALNSVWNYCFNVLSAPLLFVL